MYGLFTVSDLAAISVPVEQATLFGQPSFGTRSWCASGDGTAFEHWIDTLFRLYKRGLLSPGAASAYVGVSRTALHKALQDGRLTSFSFQLPSSATGGGEYCAYVLIPLDELRKWRKVRHNRVKPDAAAAPRLRSVANASTKIAIELKLTINGSGRHPSATKQVSEPVKLVDRIELSKLLPLLRGPSGDRIRREEVKRVQDGIANGSLQASDKLQKALDRLMEDLFR